MRKLLVGILLSASAFLASIQSDAQTQTYQGGVTTTTIYRGGQKTDSMLILPIRDTMNWPFYNSAFRAITIQPGTNKLYYNNGTSWVEVGTGSGGGGVYVPPPAGSSFIGEYTVPAGAEYAVVPHNLGAVPVYVSVTPGSGLYDAGFTNTKWYVDPAEYTATTFTIRFEGVTGNPFKIKFEAK